jgi:hypothetical protein
MGSEADQPARIINPDEASRAALQSTINGILNTEVTLAKNALTDDSILIIERNPPRTMGNPNPQGRIMDEPIDAVVGWWNLPAAFIKTKAGLEIM